MGFERRRNAVTPEVAVKYYVGDKRAEGGRYQFHPDFLSPS